MAGLYLVRWPGSKMHRLLLLALLFALAPLAGAQVPIEVAGRTQAENMRIAFDSPYGKLQIATAVRILLKNTDAACLAERKIDPASFPARVREYYLRNGTRMYTIIDSYVDTKK